MSESKNVNCSDDLESIPFAYIRTVTITESMERLRIEVWVILGETVSPLPVT